MFTSTCCRKAQDVVRLRHYVCPSLRHAGRQSRSGDEREAGAEGSRGRHHPLRDCEKRVPLWDELEELFASPEMQQRVRELQEQSDDRSSTTRARSGRSWAR